MKSSQFHSRLGSRFLVIVVPLVVLVLIAAAAVFYGVTRKVVDDFSFQLSTRQVEVDRTRARRPILREIELARTAARSADLIAWARNESDPLLREKAIDKLVLFQQVFDGRNYFFVVDQSGNYYAAGQGKPEAQDQTPGKLRYTLSKDVPADAWYFATRKLAGDCHLNPNHDRVLKVTKLWINCLLRDAGAVVGMVGTGIDLSEFVEASLKASAPNITNLFIDGKGSITAHPDLSRIAMQALVTPGDQQKAIFDLLDRSEDVQALRAAMANLLEGARISETLNVSIDGQRHLVSLSYVAPMDWFSVSVVKLDGKLIDGILGGAAWVVLAIVMMALVVLYTFNRLVLSRIQQLDHAVQDFRLGKQIGLPRPADPNPDELARLQTHFVDMAGQVRNYTAELEQRVAERTRELLELASTDALTGVFNRRVFFERLNAEMERSRRYDSAVSVLILDIDLFKQINDTHGHDVGDRVLEKIAECLGARIRQTDLLARYGGEEFTVLLPETELGAACDKAEMLRSQVESLRINVGQHEPIRVTVSIGVAQFAAQSHADSSALLKAADLALYAAKHEGRNRVKRAA